MDKSWPSYQIISSIFFSSPLVSRASGQYILSTVVEVRKRAQEFASDRVTFSERQHVCNNTRCFSGLHTLLNIWSKSERANDEFIVLSSKPINIYFSLFSYRSVQRVSVFSSAFRNTQRIMCTALTRRLCDELKIPCYSSPEACSNQTKLRRTS